LPGDQAIQGGAANILGIVGLRCKERRYESKREESDGDVCGVRGIMDEGDARGEFQWIKPERLQNSATATLLFSVIHRLRRT